MTVKQSSSSSRSSENLIDGRTWRAARLRLLEERIGWEYGDGKRLGRSRRASCLGQRSTPDVLRRARWGDSGGDGTGHVRHDHRDTATPGRLRGIVRLPAYRRVAGAPLAR